MTLTSEDLLDERKFFDELRRKICAEADTIEQAMSSSTTRKRPISNTIESGISTDDVCISNKRSMQQKKLSEGENGIDAFLRELFIKEEEKEDAATSASKPLGETAHRFTASCLHDADKNATGKSPLTLFNEFAEIVYQAAGDDMKRRNNPFDDLAKGKYKDYDYPMSVSRENALEHFVRSFYQSNDLNVADANQNKDRRNNKWNLKFEELRKYKEANGDCLVRTNHSSLGVWVAYQRQFYKLFMEGKKTSITQERVNLLNCIGFQWVV